jgi:DSF synthase
MSATLDGAYTITKSGEVDPAEVVGALTHLAGPLPQVALSYEPAIKTLWLTLRPAPKPVFTYDMLNSANAVQRAIWRLWGRQESQANSPVRYLAFRGDGPVLTLGGDLDFFLDCLAKADRDAFEAYARAAVDAVCWNASSLRGAAITLASVHGNAFGGGIDAALSCNVAVAAEHAMFSYPEVKFNHFAITAASIMSRRIGPREAHKMLSTAHEYTARQFEELGAVDAVVPKGEADAWLRRYASETLPMHAARLSLFTTFYRRAGDLEVELEPAIKMWVDSIMRLSPMQISRLQRLAQAQERMMQFLYAEKPAEASGEA